MKRFLLYFILFCLTICIFSGCDAHPPLCRIATKIEVSCRHKDFQFQRIYTQNEKMQAVLSYIRLLKPRGKPEISPEHFDKEVFQIAVFLSDGTTHIYQQSGHQYFKAYNQPWKTISPEVAVRLYRVLAQHESDLVIEI